MTSSSSNGLSKIGTILTVIFVVTVAALFVELLYVLWRRRVFYRSQTSPLPISNDNSSSESATFSPIASSKELLYFLCIRPQAQIQGNESNSIASNGVNTSNEELDMEVIDLMKINGMFGPPRFLFTIKEEEKEDMDSPAGKIRMSLKDCLNNEAKEQVEEEMVVVVDDDQHVATPFSTPCASPSYFTPSNSPLHEEIVSQ